MSKALYKYRNVVISLLIFEFVVVIASSAVVKTSFLLGLSLYILIKNTVMVAIIYYLCRVFDQEQVNISSVLGDDVSNACIFGGIGLIMYDENRNIMWTSELFREL